jgi:hypothetical protein
VPQWRRVGATDNASGRTKPRGAGEEEAGGAPVPCPADGGAAQSRGRVGAAQSKARSWCAQHSADQEKWRLPLGILSGGRVRK